MEKPDKYRKRSLADFLRYRRDDLTGRERNAFEKELQKDPFAEEANEGFSLVTDKEAAEDIKSLKKKLYKRTGRRSVTIPYRIAAALAILVGISVIFFNRNNVQEVTLSKNETESVKPPMEIAASEPVVDKTEKSENRSEAISRNESTSKPMAPPSVNVERKKIAVVTDENKEMKVTEMIGEEETDQAINKDSGVTDKDMISVAAKSDNQAMYDESEKKLEVSNAAGAAAPMAAKSRSSLEHTVPVPVTGIDSFNIYIEKGLINPHPGNLKEEVVILTFVVKTDSTISDIRVIESPGQEYSKEAKRIVREGPKWKPAVTNGKPVEEQYRLKILFR
jgi:hypothetical protein